MATIRERKRRDGSVAYAVIYTAEGRQTSDTLPDLKSAQRYRDMVNALGGAKAREAAGFGKPKRAEPVGMTLGEWLDRYIDSRTGVTKATLYDYRSYLRNDIADTIGLIPLSQLSRDDIGAWVQQMVDKGTPAKPVAGKTIANKHGFLSAALNAAVADGKIGANPAAGTRLPVTERPDMVFLTKDDFAALRDEVPAYWRPLVAFLVSSGARFGEASALRPADVNRANHTVRIVRAWKRTYGIGGYELGPPKTKKSRRTINVPADVLDGLDYASQWLFTNSGQGARCRGGPVRVANFRANVWRPAIARAGISPAPRVHDLRHTCASWLIQSGIPLPVIQRHLGHESIQTTVDLYGHIDRSSAQAAADVFGDMLS